MARWLIRSSSISISPVFRTWAIGNVPDVRQFLPLQFQFALQVGQLIEFWRRWHMTLSAFLRTILYPVGGKPHGAAALRQPDDHDADRRISGRRSWTLVAGGALHGAPTPIICINHRPMEPTFANETRRRQTRRAPSGPSRRICPTSRPSSCWVFITSRKHRAGAVHPRDDGRIPGHKIVLGHSGNNKGAYCIYAAPRGVSQHPANHATITRTGTWANIFATCKCAWSLCKRCGCWLSGFSELSSTANYLLPVSVARAFPARWPPVAP